MTRGQDRSELLDRERQPLDRVAGARPLQRVDEHPPPHPRERPQHVQHRQIQSSDAWWASPPTRPMNSSSRLLPTPAPERSSSMRPCATSRPLRDDPDVRGQPLHDLEDVRGQKDRPAAGDERQQQLLDLAGGDRVDALERFVEEQQSRTRQQRGGKRELLPHAVRVVGHQRPAGGRELHHAEQVRGAALRGRHVHGVDLRDEVERFFAGQPIEQCEILGHDADPSLDRDRIRSADPYRGCAWCRWSVAAVRSGT